MDPQLINWPAPAKLNLFLHINGRREDGYHELQSLFQLLDFGDNLRFQITDSADIGIETPIADVPNEENLIYRAALLLQQTTNTKKGCRIQIDKKLPMGGGIGGGSSNAATTLVALNYLWNTNLNIEQLASLGLSLGADVPIFVKGHTAFAEGVGEKIFPVDLQPKTYLVVNPGVHISTAGIFSSPSLPRQTPKLQWNQYEFPKTQNDCEKLVCRDYPEVANTLQWLLEYAPSRMTGTGSSVFAIFEDEIAAQQVLDKLPQNWQGFIAKGVNTSPLYELLNDLS